MKICNQAIEILPSSLKYGKTFSIPCIIKSFVLLYQLIDFNASSYSFGRNQVTNLLRENIIRYSGDAYSFQRGWNAVNNVGKNMTALVVGWVGERCSELSTRVAIP